VPLDKDALEQLQLLRTELIEPTVKHLKEAIDTTVADVKTKQQAQEQEIVSLKTEMQDLKSVWAKVVTGAIVWSTILGFLFGYIKSKIMQWTNSPR
jgi:hypothetical protein